MAGELVVEDYQFQYGELLFGCETSYDVEELSGFLGFPSVRSSTVDAFGMHGGTRGRHYVPARTFIVEMNIQGTSDAGFAILRSDLASAFKPRSDPHDELEFAYQMPSSIRRFIKCRPIDLEIPLDIDFSNHKYPHVTVRFECSDPRHYDIETNTEIATLPAPGGGLDFPLVFPLNFGAGTTSSVQLTNSGDAPAHWTASITGPVINPRIEAVSDLGGEICVLRFNGLSLSLGETLELNSRDRSVLLGGQSRRSFLTSDSRWFTIPEYPDSLTVNYTSDDPTATASTCTFTWSDATWGY